MLQPSEAARAAFTLSAVHRRRDARRITAVALTAGGQRVYLGLDNGYLEEHTLCHTTAGGSGSTAAHHPTTGHKAQQQQAGRQVPLLRLQAERKVFHQTPVTAISCCTAAARVALLAEDGHVSLVSMESFDAAGLSGARGASCLAADGSGRSPGQLAAAVRVTKTKTRLLLLEVLPGTMLAGGQPAQVVHQLHLPDPILGLAWVGHSLLIAVPGGYKLLRGSTLVNICDHLPPALPTMVCALPAAGLGLLLWDSSMVLVVGEEGVAVREPLLLPGHPLALAHAGMFAVVVCEDGVHVYDRNTSREVQVLDWYHDDAYVGLAGRLPAAADEAGKAILLATSVQVLLLQPVALEQQVRELLQRRCYAQALDLVDLVLAGGGSSNTTSSSSSATAATLPEPAAPGSPSSPAGLRAAAAGQVQPEWPLVAMAQVGQLLLLEGKFDQALTLLERCPPEVFQPCQLFYLFPDEMQRWLDQVPLRPYWHLGGPHLPRLEQLLPSSNDPGASPSPPPPPHHHHHQYGSSSTPPSPGSSTCSDSDEEGPVHQGRGAAGRAQGAEAPTAVQEAWLAVARYLSRVRGRPGVSCGAGLDLLLLQLLCQEQDAEALEVLVTQLAVPASAAAQQRGGGERQQRAGGAAGGSLVSLQAARAEQQQQGELREVVGAARELLVAAGRWHAAALLLAHAGDAQAALDVWQGMVEGRLQELPCRNGAVAASTAAGGSARVVALAAMSAELCCADACDEQLLLRYLPSLLAADAAASLRVLQCRPELHPDQVLPLLQGRGDDLLWQYLFFLVYSCGSTQAEHHTALATTLLTAITAAITAAISLAQLSQQLVGALDPLLPISYVPNVGVDSTSSSSGRGTGGGGLLPSKGNHSRHASMAVSAPHGALFSFEHEQGGSRQSAASRGQDRHSIAADGGGGRGRWGAVAGPSHRQCHLAALAGHSLTPGHRPGDAKFIAGYTPHAGLDSVAEKDAGKKPPPSVAGGAGAGGGTAAGAGAVGGGGGGAGGAGAVAAHLRGCSRTVSGIAETLLHPPTADGQRRLTSQRSLVTLAPPRPSTAAAAAAAAVAAGAVRHLPAGLGPQPVGDPAQLEQLLVLVGVGSSREGHPPAATAAGGGGEGQQTTEMVVAAAGGLRQDGQAMVAAAGGVQLEVTARELQHVLALRCHLVYHLQASLLYDAQVVALQLSQVPLHHVLLLEQFLLASRRGQHVAALQLLTTAITQPPAAVHPTGPSAGPQQHHSSDGGGSSSSGVVQTRQQQQGRQPGSNDQLAGHGTQTQEEGWAVQEASAAAGSGGDDGSCYVEGSISYCQALGSQDAWLALLEMLLKPGPGGIGSPRQYAAACRVLAAEGAHLSPLRLLAALDDAMPLHLAAPTCGRVLEGLLHRRRLGQVVRALHRCQHLSAQAALTSLQSRRLLVTEDTACQGCGRLLGSKVFHVLPSGVVLCSRCLPQGAAAAGAAGAGDGAAGRLQVE